MGNLLHRVHMIGEINDRFLLCPPHMKDLSYGKTTITPSVLEIYVDEIQHGPLNVGKIVKDKIFYDYPKFIFNVCFACARPSFWTGVSDYANPKSHWFNVFFGFYVLNAPCSLWSRPFGFTTSGDVYMEDILRLGKADWNYFSNYVYGVPLNYCQKNNNITGNVK